MSRKDAGVAGVVLLLLAAAAVWRQLDVERYKPALEAALTARFGRPVSLGAVHPSLAPVGVRVERVTIGDDPGFQTGRPFAQAAEMYVAVRLAPLLRGRFELRALELRRPVIELVRGAGGAWNVATLGRDGGQRALAIDRLVIRGGEVAITDLQASQARAVYSNIDLDIDDYSPGAPFDADIAVTLPGAGTQRLTARGTAGPLSRDGPSSLPFDGEVRFEHVSLSALRRFLRLDALADTETAISGSTRVVTGSGGVAGKGSLRFDEPRVRGVDLGYPVRAEFDVTHDAATRLVTLNAADLRLDRTPVSLVGTVDPTPQTPVVSLHVRASRVALAEAARLASAFGVAFGAGTQVDGQLTADVRLRGPLKRPSMHGAVELRDVTISGTDIPRPVRTPAVNLAITPDEIRSNDFSAATNGTSLAARFVISRYATGAPIIDAAIRTADAELGDVLTVARAWGLRAVNGVSGSGRVNADLRAFGPRKALAYTGAVTLSNATVGLPSLAQPLRVTHGNVMFSRDRAVAERFDVALGGTRAEGNVTVRTFASPEVAFDLSADRIDVAEMQTLLAPRAAGAGEGGLLRRLSGAGRLRVGGLTYAQLALEGVDAAASLDHGVVRLDPLTARLYGGRQRGTIVIDTRQTPPEFVVASRLEQIDSDRLVTAVTSVEDVIYGALGSVVRVNFSGGGGAAIARSMNGAISVDIPKGRIPNLDLLNEIGSIARFMAGGEAAAASTDVAAIRGNFHVTGGVARTDDLTATIEGGRIAVSGSANLATQALDLRVTAVLSRDFSQSVGGTRVGGLMSTVLASQQGELVVPMLVTGTMRTPRFAPDVQRIAEMKVRNVVPTLRDPRDWSAAILGAMTGRPQQPVPEQEETAPPPPQPKDPAKAVEDMLRDLLGGKRQN